MSQHQISIPVGPLPLQIEIGKLAKQADGAATVRYGDTIVLTTAVFAKEPKENVDFFPLTVDYRENTYAAGRIPGGWFKREGRPTEKEILTSRLIDRPFRPLFPKGFNHETQIIAFVLSADGQNDPDVLAIKIALYRAGRDNPIVRALQRAAENGKQVTALVELKARMDEEANILWARQLEQAGVQVVYGLIGYKTHCKIALVLRRESGKLRRYVHLGTGNYNPATGRAYSDLSFFTAREEFGADATALFNLLTGYSRPASWRKFLVAPLGLKAALLALIAGEAQAGEQGRIIAKMNALADPEVIQALCAASQAGVQVDLLVRGICCLRPGVPGVSERIRVTSVVDRFLEHARIWFFQAGGARKLFLSSGDWMQRNFVRRVDVAFPVEDPALKERIVGEILGTMLADNQRAWVLRPDGRYERVQRGNAAPLFSQEQFMALARRSAIVEVSRPAGVENLLGSQGRSRRRKR